MTRKTKTPVEIKAIPHTKSELKKFVRFGTDFYKGNDYFVPPLAIDDINTLLPSANPAFDFCEAQAFMAYRDGQPVGRIVAIINKTANRRAGENLLRFGFLEFIDDDEVVDALFDAAVKWGKKYGTTRMIGPMGFSDMDHEGMLTFGFDELGTMASIYNYPYYPAQMERMGFGKEVDYVEYRITVPEAVPDKYQRVADIVARRFDLRTINFKSAKKIKEQYGKEIFDLINEAYDGLYGYSPLTQSQINYYIDQYLGILRLDCVSLVVDKDDKLVGVGISMPSMSKALQKSGGKMFPSGWYHLLKGLKGHNDVVDLLLVAIKPEYQGKGVNALLFANLIPAFIRNGYRFAESNVELEDNENVQKQWEYFDRRLHKRRRIWTKNI